MAKTYVVDGAKLKCSCGTIPSNLKVAINHNASIEGKAQGNIKDSRPKVNIKSFGPCGNRPKRKPCDLKISGQWSSGKTDVIVGGASALLKSSKLRCNRGGTISIVDPGQKLDLVGAAPIKIRKKNKDNPYTINATWYGQADKKTGEIYAFAESGGTICGLGKAIYYSEQAGYEIASLNNIKNPNKIQVGQRVRLKALRGYNNDNYFQMLIGSFLIGELSYKNIKKNHITFDMFSKEDKWFIRKYAQNLQRLYDKGEIDKKIYDSEIKRLDGEIYDHVFGNALSRTVKIKDGSTDIFIFDEDFIPGLINMRLIGCSFGHKWKILPQTVVKLEKGEKVSLKTKVVDIGLEAEMVLASYEVKKSIGFLDLSLKNKIGMGGGVGFSIDEQGKPSFKLSGILGYGYEIKIKVK